ncbi:MAG: sensor histidine kinase, partial [Terracidiphilus sp.]
VAHDARNLVTALGLYCDLLEEPGVLGKPFLHYGGELRVVAAASGRLVEKLVAFSMPKSSKRELPGAGPYLLGTEPTCGTRTGADEDARGWELPPACPIDNFATELAANRNLLAALAGPLISVDLNSENSALPVSMTGEDLTRVLVNLVKNAAEAMPEEGRITIDLHEFHASSDAAPWLVLTVEDSGPGIPPTALESVFESGYTTHLKTSNEIGSWPGTHRGLGLSITRSIVEAAGGRIQAANRDHRGARFVIELPVRSH